MGRSPVRGEVVGSGGREWHDLMTQQYFQSERRGLLLVISAPSGGGKSAVLARLLEEQPGLSYSVSVTSRKSRGNEVEGKDYTFVTREQFEQMQREDLFYESAEVHGNLYGTRRDTVEKALAAGRDVTLDIDVQGGMDVKWSTPADAVLVFLMPPSFDVLEKRLRERATDSEEDIQRRLGNARQEMRFWRQYDYVVVNEDLVSCVKEITQILEAERRRTSRMRKPAGWEGG